MDVPNRRFGRLLIGLLLILSLGVITSCSNSSPEEAETEENEADIDDHDDGHEHDKDEHEHEVVDRIRNEGAVIHIVTPTTGETFLGDDDIVVEVEVLGFDLNAGGNHWHLLIDGSSYTMVTGGAISVPVQGLEPGDHHFEVYLVGEDHVEYEDGDDISIVVEEE